MVEVTTPALRSIMREFSPEVILYSEMLSAAAVSTGAQHNTPMMKKHPHDDPIIYQILGNDPALMAEACSILCGNGCYGIDINMGCSAPDIMKKKQGACLLNDHGRAREIVLACRAATPGNLSVKMRTGFDSYNDQESVAFARMLEDCGIDFLVVHPRYAKLGFSRTARWSIVAEIKKSLSIPVIGNGDITTPEIALKRLAETGSDAVMLARRTVQEPWIIQLCNDLLSGNKIERTIKLDDVFIRVLEKTGDLLPSELHASRALRFAFYYCNNLVFGHSLYTMLRKCPTIAQMIALVHQYFHRNPGETVRFYRGGMPVIS